MRSRLTPDHYLCPEIFALEQERIFRRVWIFAAFKSALGAPNAYVTREIGGVPVLLQNLEGEIRAFENLCPHRQLPVQLGAFGQAPMRCTYHGWTFKPDGSVRVIPTEKSLYAYDEKTRSELCLRRFAVAEIGQLVFVCLADAPPPLDDQFAPEYQQQLAEFSNSMGEVGMHANLPANYNWKLNYENVLDFNHVPYIHPNSFLPLLPELRADVRADTPLRRDQIVNHWETLPNLAAQSFMRHTAIKLGEYPWRKWVDYYGDADQYYSFYVWPNVNYICVGGMVFLLQQFHPLAPGKTEVRFTQMVAREKPGQRILGLPAILRGQMKAEVAVLNEDLDYIEAVQSHIYREGPRAQQGQYEERLIASANIYLKLLAGEQPW